jgi:hypothetical protein
VIEALASDCLGYFDDFLDPSGEDHSGTSAADCEIHKAIDADHDMPAGVAADHGMAAAADLDSRNQAYAKQAQSPVHLDSEVVEHRSWGIQAVKVARRYVQVGRIRQVEGWCSSGLRGE